MLLDARRGAVVLAWVVLSVACGGGGGSGTCTSSAECAAGETCRDGVCQVRPDGGPSGSMDAASPDAAAPDAGVECTTDEQCADAVCLGGVCCAPASACGDACCGASEVCFSNACVTPGATCAQQADCAEGQYCEVALGETPPPMPGCLASAPVGRCLDLPPTCDGEPTPGEVCVRECTVRPSIDATLEARMLWRWETEIRPSEIDVWSTPVVGRVFDTNCDGAVDILDPPNVVFVSGAAGNRGCQGAERGCLGGILRVLDGATGAELAAIERAEPSSIGFAGSSVALGDVDHDGTPEIVAVTGEGKIAVLRGDGTVLALSSELIFPYGDSAVCSTENALYCNTACTVMADDRDRCTNASGAFVTPPRRCVTGRCLPYTQGWGGGLALGDMDGDGRVEVAFGATVMEIAADASAITLRFDGALDRGGAGVRSLTYFADVDGDTQLELVTGSVAYRADGSALWDVGGGRNGYTAIANFDRGADGDTGPELVVVLNGTLIIRDAATGASLLAAPYVLPSDGTGGPPTVANFDGAPGLEVGVAMREVYVVLSVTVERGVATITELWQTANHDRSSSVTGSTVFDFEGDGRAEVIYNDECYLWVYDGATGAVRFAHPTASFTATEASLVADIDGDGRAEMLMVGNGVISPRCVNWHLEDPGPPAGTPPWLGSDGTVGGTWSGVFAFEDVAGRWVGTRPLWNQHAYSVTNVCSSADDACVPAGAHGGIPSAQRSNWEVEWLNNFRQNVQADGLFDAPDAVLSLRWDCRRQAWIATVRNLGQAILPAGVHVRLFRGAAPQVADATTSAALFPGQGTELALTIAEPPGDDTFRAEIDNDPPTFVQCDEGNDTAEATAPSCLF